MMPHWLLGVCRSVKVPTKKPIHVSSLVQLLGQSVEMVFTPMALQPTKSYVGSARDVDATEPNLLCRWRGTPKPLKHIESRYVFINLYRRAPPDQGEHSASGFRGTALFSVNRPFFVAWNEGVMCFVQEYDVAIFDVLPKAIHNP